MAKAYYRQFRSPEMTTVRANRKWTQTELCALVLAKEPYIRVARKLRRSLQAIHVMRNTMGLTK